MAEQSSSPMPKQGSISVLSQVSANCHWVSLNVTRQLKSSFDGFLVDLEDDMWIWKATHLCMLFNFLIFEKLLHMKSGPDLGQV